VDSITLPALEILFAERFIYPESRQNASPTAQMFLEFMRKYPSATAHGYAIGPDRWDYRVTLEGLFVSAQAVTPELREAFLALCKDADELRTDGDLSAWWD